MSFVCPIHDQYVHDDKRCPYCVEPEAQPESIWAGIDLNAATTIPPTEITWKSGWHPVPRRCYQTVTIDAATLAASTTTLADVVKYAKDAEDRNLKRLQATLTENLWGKPCLCGGVVLNEGQAVSWELANGNMWHEAMRCGDGFRTLPRPT